MRVAVSTIDLGRAAVVSAVRAAMMWGRQSSSGSQPTGPAYMGQSGVYMGQPGLSMGA